MTSRVATMSSADSIPQVRKRTHLLRKLVLLWLLITAYALALVLLVRKETWFPFLLLNFLTDGLLAIVAGFATRLVLSKLGWLVRTIAGAFTVVVGLAVLGYFTDWVFGIHVLELSHGYVRWADLFHLVFGIVATWAALWAWYRPASRQVEVQSLETPARSAPAVRSRIRMPQGASVQPGTLVERRIRTQSRPGNRSPVLARANRRNPFVQRPHVQLALVEEHRCPYCLEPVLRTDTRGVKECEVCHSLHHADCWEITGTCQVPHIHS